MRRAACWSASATPTAAASERRRLTKASEGTRLGRMGLRCSWSDDDTPLQALTLAKRHHGGMIGEQAVDDAPLARGHRGEQDPAAVSLHAFRRLPREFLEVRAAALPIPFDVDDDAAAQARFFGHHRAEQELNRLKRPAAATDQR